jgi:hypothetical protein
MSIALTASARRAAVLTLAATLVVGYACASGGKGAPLPPVNIEVQNNLVVPTDVTVWLVSGGGIRQQVGFVPGAQTKTFTITPSSGSQRYRLVAERQLARPIRSPSFTLVPEQTGTVTWALIPNIVTFRGRDVVETTYVDTTKK